MRELSLNVMDVAQNSVRAEATVVRITVTESDKDDRLTIEIADNGCGMTQEQVQQVIDPFFTTRTTRKVGLGVPLFKLSAEQTGGSFTLTSQVGVGTSVEAVFRTDSIDFTPLGDVAATISTIVCMNEDKDFIYTRKIDGAEFKFLSADIKKILDGVPLSEPSVMNWVEGYISEQTEELFKNL